MLSKTNSAHNSTCAFGIIMRSFAVGVKHMAFTISAQAALCYLVHTKTIKL